MNMVEKVPETIPSSKANMKPLKFSPPKINIAKITNNTVNEVFIVLPNVLEIASLNNSVSVLDFPSFKYSLIRSKIITVSLIE